MCFVVSKKNREKSILISVSWNEVMHIRAYTLTKQKQIQAKRNSKINLYDIAHKPQRPKSLIQIPKKEGKAQETWPHKKTNNLKISL